MSHFANLDPSGRVGGGKLAGGQGWNLLEKSPIFSLIAVTRFFGRAKSWQASFFARAIYGLKSQS